MVKVFVLMFLLCCPFFGVTQSSGTAGRSYSFSEVIGQLKSRDYIVAYPSWLDKVFPNVVMELSPNTPVNDLLRAWLSGLEVGFRINGKSIILFLTGDHGASRSLYARLTGVVVNSKLEPLPAATVMIVATSRGTVTNSNGIFKLNVTDFETSVTVSCVGYTPTTLALSNREIQMVVLAEAAPNGLDATEVIAYGTTSRRLNIGASCTMTGINSFQVPSGNLEDGLKARVPGVFISDANGVAGSAKSITIGGTHSLQQNNDPLFVVDGVPLAREGFLNPIGSGSAQGMAGASALNFIASDNVARITVLKDAAATSIYGSRASNGVVLITLKSGKAGPLKLSFDVSGGTQEAVRTSPLLSTGQFLALRKDAVLNDGGVVDSNSVPEAYHWGPNRQSNYQRLAIGRRATLWNGGLQAGWGNARSTFFLSGQVHRESTVFPGSTWDDRKSLYGRWQGQSENGRLQVVLSGVYGWEGNHLPTTDYSTVQWLAPNAPSFTDATGKSQWGQYPLSFMNIPALANNDYQSKVYSFLGHLQVSYRLGRQFYLEENLGFNRIHTSQDSYLRLAGQDSNYSAGGVGLSVEDQYSHLMTETISRWSGRAGPGTLEGLVGLDYQSRKINYRQLQSFYTSDSLLNAGKGAAVTAPLSDSIPYRYFGLFGRVNYNIGGKYLFTSSWRRDRSEVLGGKEPIGNFWTFGGAWVFSRERFLAGNRFLSFGKLRGSWGTTGNEPREDGVLAMALAIAAARASAGQGGQQLVIPTNLPLNWELNHREELALELGFWQDKVFLTAAVNRGWTANQWIYAPTRSAGQVFGLLSNVKGIDIENRSFELGLQLDKIRWGKLGISSSLALTVPRNRIARWPGLSTSIYTDQYVVGRSITVSRSFHSTGVDPVTGLYSFATANPSGVPDSADRAPDKGLDPTWYMGWSQRLTLGNWELEWLFDYRHQRGINPLIVLDQSNAPGMQSPRQLSNGPVEWLDHWRKPGDITRQQRLTAGNDPIAMERLNAFMGSDAYSIGASYLRLRTVTLSYRLSPAMAKRLGLREARISFSGQNLWTLTHFPVADPETQDPTVLPPMRIIVAGVHVAF